MKFFKMSVLSLAVVFAIGMTGLVACGNSASEGQEQEQTEMNESGEHVHAEYICPMKCEGEKTYSEPGECPECGMDLVKIEELEEE